jgi:hypothetical protein
MATWGAYFSSYVKKTSNPKQVELEELNEKELLSQSSNGPKRIESGSSQKSVKKLYDLAEEPQSHQPKRSASNAARVAKMFGYGTPAPEAEVKVEPVAPMATWTKIEPVAPLSFTKIDTTPALALAPAAVLPSFMERFESTATPVIAPPAPKEVESKPLRAAPAAKKNAKALPTAPVKPKSKQDVFAMLDDFASFADNPDAIQILPDLPAKKPVIAELRLETKNIVTQNTREDYRPAPARKDSFWSETESPASYRSSRKGSFQSQMSQIETPASSLSSNSFRKNPFQSQLSPLLSRPKLVVAKNASLEPSEDFRSRMEEFERQSEDLKREQKRRDEEREQILKYERMQDQMRYEREKMEIEREEMMEEQRKFEQEAARIAQEEKQMEQFMKSLKVEMERDRENEERKRRVAEEAERDKLRALEAQEREQAKIEAEERELREHEARLAQRQREAEEKERKLRLKDERLAQEEADRLTALALREAKEADRRRNEYEEELEADRRRFEVEQEEEERRRANDEEFERQRQRRFIAERAEREGLEQEREEQERFEQQEAEMERQRARDERIQTQRRVAEERVQRAQFEENESRRRDQENVDRRFDQQGEESDDDRPLTKEQEMEKAEEKIRQAFAGLAKEKDQNAQPVQRSNTVAIQMPRPIAPVKNYSRGIIPAGGESRVNKGEPEQQNADRVLGRNNTVAAFGAKPGPAKKPGVLQKPPRAPGGSLGNIGLPGGPRSGLPSGPGPKRNLTTRR